MFKTKSEVDKYVGRLLIRARTDSERNKESFKIAQLYFDRKEYQDATHYLANYLSEFSLDPYAWQLQADMCVAYEQNFSKAIEYYSKSFDLGNGVEKNLLLKICECYSKMNDRNFNANKAIAWLVKAEESFPSHRSVLELKERLLNLNGTDESNELESFLVSSLNENMLKEDLHVKLLKLYARHSNKTCRVVRHLIKLEYGEYFANSPSWYKNAIETVENALKAKATEFERSLYLTVLFVLLSRYAKLLLKSSSSESIAYMIETLIKLDECLTSLQKIVTDRRAIELIRTELLAQFYYLIALISNSMARSSESKEQHRMITLSLFIKSTLICKPTSFDGISTPSSSKQLKEESFDKQCEADLVRFVHRESALRYSIIGNWLQYIVGTHFADDQIEMIEQLKLFTSEHDIKSELLKSFGILEDNKLWTESSLLKSSDLKFDIENILVLDHLTLAAANKLALVYQTSNLCFLVWYCLANTRFNSSNRSELTELPPYLLFRPPRSDSSSSSNISFGLTNLNICNLESICVLDLKVFLYSVYFQAISRLVNDSVSLEPFYHAQTTQIFTTDVQRDWWLHISTSKLLASPPSRHHHQRIKTSELASKTTWLDTPLDEPMRLLSISSDWSSKKQADLMRVLELVRLKSHSIKLDSNRYKLNLKVCAHVAKYLQHLCDCLSLAQSSVVDKTDQDTIRQLTSGPEIGNQSAPKEKLTCLRLYASRYWNFVCQQAIKLRKLDSINTPEVGNQMSSNTTTAFELSTILEGTDLNDSSMFMSASAFLHDTTNMNATPSAVSRMSFGGIQRVNSGAFVDYFSFHEPSFITPMKPAPLSRLNMESRRSTMAYYANLAHRQTDLKFWDSLIQLGSLNLIYANIQEAARVPNRLDEALEWFNLMDAEENPREYTKLELDLCKKIAESLVNQRNELELNKNRLLAEEPSQEASFEQRLDKLNALIESIKKKINLQFQRTSTAIETESEQEAEEKPLTLEKNAETEENTVSEVEIDELSEKLKLKTIKEEATEKARRDLDEERQRLEEERLEQEKRLERERERLESEKIQLAAEMERIRRESAELERRRVEQEQHILLQKQQQHQQQPTPQKKQEKTTQEYVQVREEQQSGSQKILELMGQIMNQRVQHLQMNIDTLREQYDLIRTQNKQIENEIKQMNKSSGRRMSHLNQIEQSLVQLGKFAIMQSSISQFSEMVAMFQQNPGFTHSFLNLYGINPKLPGLPGATPRFVSISSVLDGSRTSIAAQQQQMFGELKFPTNFSSDLFGQMTSSAHQFNLERKNVEENEYYDEEEGDEDDYEDYEDDEGEENDYEDGEEDKDEYEDGEYDEDEGEDEDGEREDEDEEENDEEDEETAREGNSTFNFTNNASNQDTTFASCNDNL